MNRPDEPAGSEQVFGIIPAAGVSRRMGQAKQLLPFGDRTILETVINSVLGAPISGLAVVTNSQVADELDLSDDPRFLTVLNDDAESQMLDSIRLGLDVVRKAFAPPAEAGILVCPGDMPEIDVATTSLCYRVFIENSGQIVVASHQQKHGHPVIVPLSMTPELESIQEGGLAALLHRHAEAVHAVEFETPAVCRDIDTPEDYNDRSASQ